MASPSGITGYIIEQQGEGFVTVGIRVGEEAAQELLEDDDRFGKLWTSEEVASMDGLTITSDNAPECREALGEVISHIERGR